MKMITPVCEAHTEHTQYFKIMADIPCACMHRRYWKYKRWKSSNVFFFLASELKKRKKVLTIYEFVVYLKY